MTVVASGAGLPVRPIAAQPPTRAVSQTLLRRLAEIVDGNRSGQTIFIVASYTYPHGLVDVYTSREEAMRSAARDTAFGVFGPFTTVADSGRFFIGCKHDQIHSYMETLLRERGRGVSLEVSAICPPERLVVLPPGVAVDSARITVFPHGAPPRTAPIDPRADAMFFTLSALDKFVFPYYAKVLGIDSTAVLRRRFIEGLRATR